MRFGLSLLRLRGLLVVLGQLLRFLLRRGLGLLKLQLIELTGALGRLPDQHVGRPEEDRRRRVPLA